MSPIKKDPWGILKTYYPKTSNALTRLGQIIKLVNPEVDKTTQLQDSIIKLSESEDFLKNITNVVQDYVDPEALGEDLPEIVKSIASSILSEVAVSKELIQALDAILLAIRDIPQDVMEAFYGLEFNANFPHKEPQWTPDPNKNPYSISKNTSFGVPSQVPSQAPYTVTHTNRTKYVGNVQPPKKVPSKKPSNDKDVY